MTTTAYDLLLLILESVSERERAQRAEERFAALASAVMSADASAWSILPQSPNVVVSRSAMERIVEIASKPLPAPSQLETREPRWKEAVTKAKDGCSTLREAVSDYLKMIDQRYGDDYFSADRRAVRMRVDEAMKSIQASFDEDDT